MKPEDVKPKFLWRSFGVQGYEPVEAIPAHEVGAIIKAAMAEKDFHTRLNWLEAADRLEAMK